MKQDTQSNHTRALLGAIPQDCPSAAPLFRLVNDLADRLGDKIPLLWEYISGVLESSGAASAFDAESYGYEAGSRLLDISRTIMQTPAHSYGAAPDTELLSSDFDDIRDAETRSCLCFAELSDAYFFDAYDKYLKDRQSHLAFCTDVPQINKAGKQLGGLLGEPAIAELYGKLRDLFFPCPALEAFRHGYSAFLLRVLTRMDADTGKQIWQLWCEYQ